MSTDGSNSYSDITLSGMLDLTNNRFTTDTNLVTGAKY